MSLSAVLFPIGGSTFAAMVVPSAAKCPDHVVAHAGTPLYNGGITVLGGRGWATASPLSSHSGTVHTPAESAAGGRSHRLRHHNFTPVLVSNFRGAPPVTTV